MRLEVIDTVDPTGRAIEGRCLTVCAGVWRDWPVWLSADWMPIHGMLTPTSVRLAVKAEFDRARIAGKPYSNDRRDL